MGLVLDRICYKDKIKNFSYEFNDGKITTVIGSSGSGKTLLSYILAGIIKDYTGNVISSYNGRDIGYVFQNPEDSFIFTSVKEEISFGLKKYNYKMDILNKHIADSLKLVNLPIDYLDKNPFSLSSGEKKLVSLCTTLALNPKIIILDDPTVGLDNRRKEELIRIVKKLKTRYNKTIIVFTSDVYFASKICDNFLILKKCKLFYEGKKKELLTCGDKFTNANIYVPKIMEFIETSKKKKGITLEDTFDIKELMKDIYRNV